MCKFELYLLFVSSNAVVGTISVSESKRIYIAPYVAASEPRVPCMAGIFSHILRVLLSFVCFFVFSAVDTEFSGLALSPEHCGR